jgi:hypothetical protein
MHVARLDLGVRVGPVDSRDVDHCVDAAQHLGQAVRVGKVRAAQPQGLDAMEGAKSARGVPTQKAESSRDRNLLHIMPFHR